jgi:hypothetical protein
MNVLFSVLLLLAPLRMETGRFTIYQDGKKIGTEDFSITPRSGGYVIEGHTVINTSDQNADLLSHMELNDALKPTAYQFTSSVGSIRLKVDSPTSQLEYAFQGDKQTEDIRFPDDGVIIDTNFFHHYAILLYRLAGKSGGATVPAFAPQELRLGTMNVRSLGNNMYEMDTGNLRVTATTDKDGRLIRLSVPDAKVVVER